MQEKASPQPSNYDRAMVMALMIHSSILGQGGENGLVEEVFKFLNDHPYIIATAAVGLTVLLLKSFGKDVTDKAKRIDESNHDMYSKPPKVDLDDYVEAVVDRRIKALRDQAVYGDPKDERTQKARYELNRLGSELAGRMANFSADEYEEYKQHHLKNQREEEERENREEEKERRRKDLEKEVGKREFRNGCILIAGVAVAVIVIAGLCYFTAQEALK